VLDTTIANPAPESADLASEYFCPTTLGDDAALAAPAPATAAAMVAAVQAMHIAIRGVANDFMTQSSWPCCDDTLNPAVTSCGVHWRVDEHHPVASQFESPPTLE
jgi:hypothetical protein